eukprot:TRINITY_DN2360_c0_g1_i2.p1 TRINITY_DN2360_c0_g1~~TRINITY_DN2360_c0_g1_i2.p1  ORF type:complete len:277 (-),score=104.92 TRINITY_DN2360_c0_g1_i2:86-889(-)
MLLTAALLLCPSPALLWRDLHPFNPSTIPRFPRTVGLPGALPRPVALSRRTQRRATDFLVGESGRQLPKPTAATAVPRKRPVGYAQTLADRLEWQRQYEVEDDFAKEVAADLIRQVTMVFYVDPSSPWHTDPTKLRKPMRRRKQENVDFDEMLPIPFPRDLPGQEWIPSRIAIAVYNRGYPVGCAIAINKLIDYGTNLHIIATYHPEHDMLRSMFIGVRGHTIKQLTLVMNEQLTIQYQRPVTVQLYIETTPMWSKLIGGLWRFMPY